jgi:hypothetical protein
VKTICARAVILVIGFFGCAAIATANDVQSKIVTSTSPLTINIPDDHFLVIRNFTQQGGTARGTVTITIDSQTADILSAAIIDSSAAPETINRVVLAGPSSVLVSCPDANATCFVTYLKDAE